MKNNEAIDMARRLNRLDGVTAKVVRILPGHTDPVKPGDNGWDVEVDAT